MTKKLKIIVISIATMALIIGLAAGRHFANTHVATAEFSGTLFTPPQPIANFSLVDTKGRSFDNQSLWGHWTLMFFGFTRCAQICPPAMANLNKIYTILLQKQQNPMPQVVFVSIDPEHDTLAKLGAYVSSFNPHFQGATGKQSEIDKLAASMNVLYLKSKKTNNNPDDMVDHSGAILLVEPSGKLVAIFSMPHDPKAIARDFQLIVKNSG